MKIVLTGATGRVGSRLLRRLASQHHELRVIVRDPDASGAIKEAGAEPVVSDLLEPDRYRAALDGADAVVHLAAVLRSNDTAEVSRGNEQATRALAQAAHDARIGRFVFTSTNLVYPGGLGRPASEDDRPDPLPAWGAYPVSKLRAEQHLLNLHRRHGLPVRILRLAFVYGDGDPHLSESLRWAGQWPSHQRLHLIHHADVANAVIRALDTPGADGRIYNAADDAPVTAWELHALTGAAHPDGDHDTADPWHGIVHTGRIRAELGFRPLYPSAWAAYDAGAL
jgi:nucleoside-diphosphate-sugar epimerase